MKTLAFRTCSAPVPPYVVLVHSDAAPNARDWSAYLATLRAVLADTRGRVPIFIATDGGGPDANQRKQLADVVGRGPGEAMSHIFTTDAFVRGIVTAFRWISRARAVAHHPFEFGAVCAQAGVSPMEVLDDLLLVQRDFVPVITLTSIAEGARPALKRA